MEKEFGLISILMAAYNSENTISQAISSVLKQTYTKFELIVVNDCSQDRTSQIIEQYAIQDNRVILINNKENCGVSYTRKRGLQKAKGEWIAILDSDDIWKPQKLEKQVFFQQKNNADLIFTGSAFMDADGKKLDYYLHVPTEIGYKQLLKQNLISNSSALVRKNLYQKHYAIGDSMHEDFATWLEILKTGCKACGIDEPLLIYRLDKNSKSGNKIRSAKMNWNTFDYIGLNCMQKLFYIAFYTVNGINKYKKLHLF